MDDENLKKIENTFKKMDELINKFKEIKTILQEKDVLISTKPITLDQIIRIMPIVNEVILTRNEYFK